MNTQTTTMTPEQLKDIITGNTHVYCLTPGSREEWMPVDTQSFWNNVLTAPMNFQKPRTYEVIHHPYSDQVYIHSANIRTEETMAETLGRVLFQG